MSLENSRRSFAAGETKAEEVEMSPASRKHESRREGETCKPSMR